MARYSSEYTIFRELIQNSNDFVVDIKELHLSKFYAEKISVFSEIRKNIYRIDACHLEAESIKYENCA